jgi:hypothetical protein
MSLAQRDTQSRRVWLRLGLLQGLLVGLALALGTWAPDALAMIRGPVRAVTASLPLGLLALLLLGALAGWLAAWAGRAWASLLIWILAATLMILAIGHLPYEGRSLIIWLSDRRAWGLPIYPSSETAQTALALGGFFVLLVLATLGLLQPYRLEGIAGETDRGGRLEARGWFLLLLPLPLILITGIIADSIVNRPLRTAPQMVHEAIRVGRTYEGDLFALSLERGLNYNAISGVRGQMSAEYRLSIGASDLELNQTVFVVADFDNGAWIQCRVVNEQLSFCYDASLPYTQGFASLLASGQTPEDCPGCSIWAGDELRTWLAERRGHWRGTPQVTRLAQWGSYVLMRAESASGDYALECLFQGVSPVFLESCQVVRGPETRALALPTAGAGNSVPLVAAGVAAEGPAPAPSPERETIRLEAAMWDPRDRLGPPPLSEPPTQVELGHYAYYLSCMVCHGDQGQGLAAWREVLPEEDRDCWQSRCHAANHPPGGFQFPAYAPPVMGPGTLAGYQTAAELHDSLRARMPWQAPGLLPAEEYWQITAYLAQAHGADLGTELLTVERAVAIRLHGEPAGTSP